MARARASPEEARRRFGLSRLSTGIALALASLPAWAAAASSVLVSRPGDQTNPSVSGSYVAFLDYGVTQGVPQVWWTNLTDPANPDYRQLDATGAVVGGPEAAGYLVAYRTPGYVKIYDASLRGTRSIPAPGSGRVVLSAGLAAWEQSETQGSATDLAWQGAMGVTVLLPRSGSQRALAVSNGWIAFIDDHDASVHLLDTNAYRAPAVVDGLAVGETVVAPSVTTSGGAVTEVAIWAPDAATKPTVALLSDEAGGSEVTIVDLGWTRPAALATPTAKANLHLFGAWVAFDDENLGERQVRLVNWDSGRSFFPEWRGNPQTLNYLAGSDSAMKVVWTEAGLVAGSGLDLWEFSLALPLDDGSGSGSTVTCGSTDAEVLATLELLPAPPKAHDGDGDDDGDHHGDDGDDDEDRDDDGHEHETALTGVRPSSRDPHGWRSYWRAFAIRELACNGCDPSAPRRVVVCIDSTDVTSGWVGVGVEVVASPADFKAGTLSLEARLTVPPNERGVAAVAIAKGSSTLRVRVLNDPEGDVNAPPEGTTCSAVGNCPSPPRGIFGCGSSGGAASVLSLLLVGLVAARPARRRSRS